MKRQREINFQIAMFFQLMNRQHITRSNLITHFNNQVQESLDVAMGDSN